MFRDALNEKILKGVMRKEFATKQMIERFRWEEEVLIPAVNKFKAQAKLPEPPSEKIISIEYEDQLKPPKKSKRLKSKKKPTRP